MTHKKLKKSHWCPLLSYQYCGMYMYCRMKDQPSGTRVFWQYANCIWAVLSALPVSGRALRICFGDPFEAALRRNNHGKR